MIKNTYRMVGFITTVALLLFDGTASAQTSGSVQLLKKIRAGREGSDPGSFVVLNGAAYFRANDGIHGYELWRLMAQTPELNSSLILIPGRRMAFPTTSRSLTAVFTSPLSMIWPTLGRRFGVAMAQRPEQECWSIPFLT
jgi:hypothetical protein